jgi:hypothetical protein
MYIFIAICEADILASGDSAGQEIYAINNPF